MAGPVTTRNLRGPMGLTPLYVSALSLVALLALLGQLFLQSQLSQQTTDAGVINLAGRQRMFSQKMSKAVLDLQSEPDQARREELLGELGDVIAIWERSQAGLRHGDPGLGLPGNNSVEVAELFSDIEPRYRKMLLAAKKLVAAGSRADEAAGPVDASEMTALAAIVLSEEVHFLEGMDAIVFQFEFEAGARLSRVRLIGQVLLGSELLLLLLIGFFLFRPAARRIRQNISTLENAEREVRAARDGLEIQVQERTRDLSDANLHLQVELAERQKAQEAMKASEARLAEAQRIAHFGNWEWDIAADAFSGSDEFFHIFSLRRDDVGRDREQVWERVHPDDVAAVKTGFLEALETGGELDFDHRIVLPDTQERTLHMNVQVIMDESNGPIRLVGTVQDVTEKKALEAQLLHSQKMEAVGRLSGGIAHDFNNLLTVIRGYTELILGHPQGEGNLRRQAEEIQKAADRGASLTRQLLAFSRSQVMGFTQVNINEQVVEAQSMLRRLIGENIVLTTKLCSVLGLIRADAGQIQQIIINLVVNARDAMPHGGEIVLETSTVELDEATAMTHENIKPGCYVTLSVTDTGKGMDQRTLSHAFEPFFTTKPKDKGTGLGLATVYGIVRQYGGWVHVDSEVGKGTTFLVCFPLQDPGDPVAKADQSDRRRVPVGGAETILLVEDEMSVRRLVRQFLEEGGYKVLEATDGREALQMSQTYTRPIHLLIADIILPGMSGFDVVHELTVERPSMKALYISGYADGADGEDKILNQEVPGLQKPFLLEQLDRKIREVLDATESASTGPAESSHDSPSPT